MKKIVNDLMLLLLVVTVLVSCTKEENKEHKILLSTTTSTDNSGLLDYLKQYFEEDTGITLEWVAKGTGAALEMGKTKEADILMVHDKTRELDFMKEGYGLKRSDLMYNDFVVVGPKDSTLDASSLEDCLETIANHAYEFISRGDNSGTHSKETGLWDKFSIDYDADWYTETGQGMGATLTMANEKRGYTLTDRATFLTMKDDLDLKIVFENDEDLFNQYGIIIVMPHVEKNMNTEDAEIFYEWLISERGQNLIHEFGKDTYGQQLFFANAKKE